MLCNMIVEGELDAGCKVPCARFGASRTPHREMLKMLSERLGNCWKIIVPAGALP
jgi:DNA-binding GntR family transcriptional regulator